MGDGDIQIEGVVKPKQKQAQATGQDAPAFYLEGKNREDSVPWGDGLRAEKHHWQIQNGKLKVIVRHSGKDIVKPGKHLQHGGNGHKGKELLRMGMLQSRKPNAKQAEAKDHEKTVSWAPGVGKGYRFFVVKLLEKCNERVFEQE